MKKYKFDLVKYFDDEEMGIATKTFEAFMAKFADDNGVAEVAIMPDVKATIKRDEGMVFHLVIESDDYDGMGKTLKRAKQIAYVVLAKMADAVKDAQADEASDDVENSFLEYIGSDFIADNDGSNDSTLSAEETKKVLDIANKYATLIAGVVKTILEP